MTKKQFNDFIEEFDFIYLFNQLGWDDLKQVVTPIKINNEIYNLKSVAGKSGFRVLECPPDSDGNIPLYPVRLKIDSLVSKLFKEHLLIFVNGQKTQQVWQTNVKHAHQPLKLSTAYWYKGQAPELLYQKAAGLIFTLDEEENITIVDVVDRVKANFSQNNERITKQFYDKFKKEHTSFIGFIKGIDDKLNRDWYASLMLNRLMFCYFIQKKGFLDNDRNYLSVKLKHCQEKKGANQFYSFYRDFLLLLFHNGLGSPDHDKALLDEIGNIPYLNGGLFDEHELEVNYQEIDIDDRAFERIFAFFDEWNWHLDTRATATGKDINPDVIGYIFEKYINDRANMGAYYTKEDITEYISKNCILPYLFDETKRQYPNAFGAGGWIWELVKQGGDKYIYDAVKRGVEITLPNEVSAGINNVAARSEWNKPAVTEFALPTEIWREVVERRNRYTEIKAKIDNDEILVINDFITYNLDIRQFAQDLIESCNDADFLRHFYNALNSVTILDPTCGSGAFLFAALNILEPLYESCLTRMRNFTDDEDRLNKQNNHNFLNKYKYFRQVLEETQNEQHPNLQYYIYKSIILRNLYGVDIMKEAVEIAKLRLFLKLVATVDVDYKKPNMGLEPLPDIDFNIRSGNTLIGFGTEAELKRGLEYTFDGVIVKPIIEEKCDIVAKAFARYKEIQLSHGDDYKAFKKAKEELFKYLKELNHELNLLLHKQTSAIEYNTWLNDYKPFHWFAEFYEIISGNGGFDIIIGNPPYLELREINYKPEKLRTFSTGAVHCMCIERSIQVLKENGNISMIVPLSIVCTQRMIVGQNILEKSRSVWYSNFSWRPGKLFDEVNRALTIFVSNHSSSKNVYVTKYFKWQSETREQVFPSLYFVNWNKKRSSFWVPKIGDGIEVSILSKILTANHSITHLIANNSSSRVYYRTTGGLYWKIFTNFSPKFFLNGKEGKSSRETSFAVKEKEQDVICVALLSSNLFWWWYTVTSNLRDINPSDIQGFKFPSSILEDHEMLKLGKKYLVDLNKNSSMLTRIQKKTGETQTQSFKIAISKPILDQIDNILANHYKLSKLELDFIVNYDIKYRMGKELENDEE